MTNRTYGQKVGGFPRVADPNYDQDQINRAIMAYETARMAARPKPKFILEIKDSHFYAKPSRGTIWDAVIVAITGAAWFAILTGLWVIFA